MKTTNKKECCIVPACNKIIGHDGYYCEAHHSKYYFGKTDNPCHQDILKSIRQEAMMDEAIASASFLQIGRTQQCGHCNPKEFGEGLKQAIKAGIIRCDCICHDKSIKFIATRYKDEPIHVTKYDNKKDNPCHQDILKSIKHEAMIDESTASAELAENIQEKKCGECGFVSSYGRPNYHSFECSKNPDFNTTPPVAEWEKLWNEMWYKTRNSHSCVGRLAMMDWCASQISEAKKEQVEVIRKWAEEIHAPIFFCQDGTSVDWMQKEAYLQATRDLLTFLERVITI